MKTYSYHWHRDSRRRPRHRPGLTAKLWFALSLVACALGLGVIALMAAFYFLKKEYAAQVDQFDLSQVGLMEAATCVYDENGTLLGKFFLQDRHPIDWNQIPPAMVHAVVAAEDNRFYDHDGVDYWGILRASLENFRSGRIKQGASTITQQLARNSFGMTDRTYRRKIVEIFLAYRLEHTFSKSEILQHYLNRVYFGSGFYGVDSAARGYFGLPAQELQVSQCALLAGLLKSPNRLSPWNHPQEALASRNGVLDRMRDCGFLSAAQARAIQQEPLGVQARPHPYKESYAIDYIRQQAISILGYEQAMQGDFSITTTLNAGMQKAAEIAVQQRLKAVESEPGYTHETYEAYVQKFKPFDAMLHAQGFFSGAPTPHYLQGAVIAYDNKTGGILALVGGRNFIHSEYNRALQAKRPVGTTFVPFVFAAAYEQGWFPGDLVQDTALDNRYVNIGGLRGILGEWGVEQKGNTYEGAIPLREALVKSKNAATVRLGWRVGQEAVAKLVHDAGIQTSLRPFSNTFLGSSEMTLAELSLAFTIFPNQGYRSKTPHIIAKIQDSSGKIVYTAQSLNEIVLSEGAAFQTHEALFDILHTGVGKSAYTRYGLQEDAAGKPGTAYDFTDAYFVGYTRAVTCGVWVGLDQPARIFRGAFGSQIALPIWVDVMKSASKSFAATPFEKPEGLVEVEIDRRSGQLATASEMKATETGEADGVGRKAGVDPVDERGAVMGVAGVVRNDVLERPGSSTQGEISQREIFKEYATPTQLARLQRGAPGQRGMESGRGEGMHGVGMASGSTEGASNVIGGLDTKVSGQVQGAFSGQKPANEPWPRAESAVPLETVQPIGVSAPALVGVQEADAYQVVLPKELKNQWNASKNAGQPQVRIAKALPVEGSEREVPEDQNSASESTTDAISLPLSEPAPIPKPMFTERAEVEEKVPAKRALPVNPEDWAKATAAMSAVAAESEGSVTSGVAIAPAPPADLAAATIHSTDQIQKEVRRAEKVKPLSELLNRDDLDSMSLEPPAAIPVGE